MAIDGNEQIISEMGFDVMKTWGIINKIIIQMWQARAFSVFNTLSSKFVITILTFFLTLAVNVTAGRMCQTVFTALPQGHVQGHLLYLVKRK